MSDITRRAAVTGIGATLGGAAFAVAMEPVRHFTADLTLDQFLQRHYRELSPLEIHDVLQRVEADALREHDVHVSVADDRPIPGVQFGYALNLSVCNGCRKCAEACHHENNHDRASNQSYIRVFEMEQGSLDFEHADATYDHAVPAPGTTVLDAAGDSVGRVVSAAPSEEGAVHLLVVVALDAVSNATALHLAGPGDPQLRLVAPPYPLEG